MNGESGKVGLRMTSNFLLDWLALAVSLHNTILLLWLGLTVYLNAERRTWGIVAASASLLFASAFFFSHSAILGLGLNLQAEGLDLWWHLGWIPVIVSPFGWLAVVLWYSGYWDEQDSPFHRRHRVWFILAALLALGLLSTIVFANPLPTFAEILSLQYPRSFQIGGIPVLLLAFVAEIFLCIALSIDALAKPQPSTRVMGDLARRRARTWLFSAAMILLIVGLMVAGIVLWITTNSSLRVDAPFIFSVGALDLVISTLIGVSIFLIGQAIALYEVFTGKVLPRRGLVRRWHNAVILAIGFSFVAALSLTLRLHPIYNVFLATALVAIFYALYAWRSYVERDHSIRDLRPFITSQHVYDSLLRNENLDARGLFTALARDLLNARQAYLVAMGPLAPLVPLLAYPDVASPIPSLAPARFDSPQTICVPLDPTLYAGALWAVPLWSERGLSGVLMLGEKSDGGLYAQEEIEIARASGERLIDVIASAELARRLMALQRERLAETQLLDRRARRVLHDEVLPQLHAAMLTLDSSSRVSESAQTVNELLTAAHHQISDLLREMPSSSASDISRLGWVAALRAATSPLESEFSTVSWDLAPEVDAELRGIAPMVSETLFFAAREAIRNAARHSRAKNLWVRAGLDAGLTILIEDDGVGQGGNADSSQKEGGQGLALHSAMMAVIGGTLAVEPRAGGGTRVRIFLGMESQRRMH